MKERKLGILGKKVGMTTVYDESGAARGVTVVEVGPCVVLQKRTTEANDKGRSDGYVALQLGFDPKPAKQAQKRKAEVGHLAKAGGIEKARRFVRELRVSAETAAKFEVGQNVSLADLDIKPGDKVDVAGRTIGKGYQGVVRKYNFRGFHKSHAHEVLRHGGSIGCRKSPGRVFKGRKMPGQMGDKNRTTQNIRVVQVRTEENVLLLHGSVPGPKNGYLSVRPAIKKNPLP